MTITRPTKALLALLSLNNVGPKTVQFLHTQKLLDNFSIDDIAASNIIVARALNESQDAWDRAQEFAEEQLHLAEADNIRIISILDHDYPALLKDSKDDPCLLYVKGQLHDGKNSVAVIGTRKSTSYGEKLTREITAKLVEQKQSIVSGLALGCDTVAHDTAIRNGGHTVAVLAHGLQTIFPASNRQLAEKILNTGGALVSQYPIGTDTQPFRFVERDKTQAGLSRGVVMVQSPVNGGSLHASRAAISYGRWLASPVYNNPEESNTSANTLLATGTDKAKCELLKCRSYKLNNVFILDPDNGYSELDQWASDLGKV